MKPLKVFTAACYAHTNDKLLHEIAALGESCHLLGLDFGVYGLKESWSIMKRIKINLALEYVRTLKGEYECCLWTDGSDSFMMGNEDEILGKFSGEGILLSGNKDCWPHPDIAEDYPYTGQYPWRFASPGGWMGTVEAAIEALEAIQDTGHSNDSPAWHELFMKWATLPPEESPFPMEVDNACDVFQNMDPFHGEYLTWTDDGRLCNEITLAHPVVFHWSGRLHGMPKMFEEWKESR